MLRGDWRRAEGITIGAGGAVAAGTARIGRELGRQRSTPQKSRARPERRLATSRGNHEKCGGRRRRGHRMDREGTRASEVGQHGRRKAARRDGRLQKMRRASSTKPLHQHRRQVLPAAQAGGGSTHSTNRDTLDRTPGAVVRHRPPVRGADGGGRMTFLGGTTTT